MFPQRGCPEIYRTTLSQTSSYHSIPPSKRRWNHLTKELLLIRCLFDSGPSPDAFPPQWELVPKWTLRLMEPTKLLWSNLSRSHDPKEVERTLTRLSLIEIHASSPVCFPYTFLALPLVDLDNAFVLAHGQPCHNVARRPPWAMLMPHPHGRCPHGPYLFHKFSITKFQIFSNIM